VHFTVGLPPLLRIDGDLTPIKYRPLTIEETQQIVGEILTPDLTRELDTRGAADLSYATVELGRFRVNVCRQARGTSAICRVVPYRVIELEKLGLPSITNTITSLQSGLVLVTGSTGSGKSTTLAAIVDAINRTRQSVIITLEDPVEFTHENQKSLVIQREIGVDVRSFAEGLRSALRQDPDVILVGELRDRDAMALALEAAETGQLVLGTLHTRGAAQTIDRILDSFPLDEHDQVRTTLADNLKIVVSQALIRVADGRGRRVAAEVLVNMPSVAQLIRDGKTFQIPNAMETGRRHGMQLMDTALMALVKAGDVDPADAYASATNRALFQPYLETARRAHVRAVD
jgi:twitching motility protein PilT